MKTNLSGLRYANVGPAWQPRRSPAGRYPTAWLAGNAKPARYRWAPADPPPPWLPTTR